MNRIKRDIQDVERFEEILHILFDQGFGLLLDEIDLLHRIPLVKRLKKPRKKEPAPERVRETFEELGPAFIKFGQMLSQRPDIIGREYADELEKLEDSVPAFSGEKAREIVDEEVGIDRFREFNQEPVASASIAQVHEARLETGEKVAVKVRRPGIKQRIERDIDVILFLTKEADRHILKTGMLEDDIREWIRWTREEVDLEREAHNAEVLRENLADDERIRIPQIYHDLGTEKVLVMEYIDAVKSTDVEKLEQMDVDLKELARAGVEAHLRQMYRDGFFHADPHPSNFMVDENGRLVYLDFGIIGKLTKQKRIDLALLVYYIYDEDIESLAEIIEKISYKGEEPDIEGLKNDLERTVLKLNNATIKQQKITTALAELAINAADRDVYLPNYFIVMGKGISTMEGMGMKVYPEFDFEKECMDQMEKIMREQVSPKKSIQDLKVDALKNRDLFTKLPSKLNEMTEKQETRILEVGNRDGGHKEVIAAALILSSTVLLLQPSEKIFLLGLAELLVAFMILWRE